MHDDHDHIIGKQRNDLRWRKTHHITFQLKAILQNYREIYNKHALLYDSQKGNTPAIRNIPIILYCSLTFLSDLFRGVSNERFTRVYAMLAKKNRKNPVNSNIGSRTIE
jgi:hypothetical protein